MSVMTENQQHKLRQLLEEVMSSSNSSLYRDHYLKHGVSPEDVSRFPLEDIPPISWKTLRDTPLHGRVYSDESSIVKIVRRKGDVAFFARTLSDIEEESFGTVVNRPLVAFTSLFEGIEKSLWVYQQNRLPLIAEERLGLTLLTAKKYAIDSIVGDTHSINALLPELEREYDLSHIRHINVVDTVFCLEKITASCPKATVYMLLALPETGGIARVCPESVEGEDSVFHTLPNVLLEPGEDAFLTKLSLLPTPIIRYGSGLTTERCVARCRCEYRDSFLLKENRRAG